jgi:hypothetical protein
VEWRSTVCGLDVWLSVESKQQIDDLPVTAFGSGEERCAVCAVADVGVCFARKELVNKVEAVVVDGGMER